MSGLGGHTATMVYPPNLWPWQDGKKERILTPNHLTFRIVGTFCDGDMPEKAFD